MTTTPSYHRNAAHDSGFALVTIVIVMVPLMAMVMAMSSLMTGRDARLVAEMGEYRALHAAESGLDESIYRFRNGTLAFGAPSVVNMGDGISFSTVATWLDTDGDDNDTDGDTDEADEHVVELIVTGTYRHHRRRLALYLTPRNLAGLRSAVTVRDPGVELDIDGTTTISGHDTAIDGSAAMPVLDVPGISISPPGTVAHLDDELDAIGEARVSGLGGTPSLAIADDGLDIPAIVDHYRTSADEVLLLNSYSAYDFGDGLTGIAQSTFRDGNVLFDNASHGAGVLVVTGDLEMVSGSRFDGLIILGGDLRMSGNAIIRGAIVQASTGDDIGGHHGSTITYSTQALTLANTVWTVPAVASGWQQITDN